MTQIAEALALISAGLNAASSLAIRKGIYYSNFYTGYLISLLVGTASIGSLSLLIKGSTISPSVVPL